MTHGEIKSVKMFAWKPLKVEGKWIWLRYFYHNAQYKTHVYLPLVGVFVIDPMWHCYPDHTRCKTLKPIPPPPTKKLMSYNDAMKWLISCKSDAEQQEFMTYYKKHGHKYSIPEREFMLEVFENQVKQ